MALISSPTRNVGVYKVNINRDDGGEFTTVTVHKDGESQPVKLYRFVDDHPMNRGRTTDEQIVQYVLERISGGVATSRKSVKSLKFHSGDKVRPAPSAHIDPRYRNQEGVVTFVNRNMVDVAFPDGQIFEFSKNELTKIQGFSDTGYKVGDHVYAVPNGDVTNPITGVITRIDTDGHVHIRSAYGTYGCHMNYVRYKINR